MRLPKISINIPVSVDSQATIVLKSLEKIDYPRNLYEVIIVKGNHLTRQRNKAITRSSGEIIYLLDNDSEVRPSALRILAKEFSRPEVAVVGGPSLPPKQGQTYFGKIVSYTLQTYFGAFRMRHKWSRQYKLKKASDYLFIGCNLALRKQAVLKAGGFNEKFQANDENELIRRLHDRKYILKYCERLYVRRNQRDNIFQLIKQFHHYGKGRAKHILHNPKTDDLFLLAPVCFLIYVFGLFFIRSWIYYLPISFYIALAIATSLKAVYKYRSIDLLFSMTLLYPIIHFSYAAGLIQEFSYIFLVHRLRNGHENSSGESNDRKITIWKIKTNRNYLPVNSFLPGEHNS